jgi:hypothetical protein
MVLDRIIKLGLILWILFPLAESIYLKCELMSDINDYQEPKNETKGNDFGLFKGGSHLGVILRKNFLILDLYRGKIMRKIDCAHSRSVKMLP